MAENKALVIDVQKKSVPQGAPKQWENLSNIQIFTRDIITPDIQNDADVSALVSGIPTVFARANLFSSAIAYNGSIKDSTSALNQYYQSLVDEWRGLIACLAFDANAIEVKRINLGYSDGREIKETSNVYEPTGAFGNMLFNSTPKWCMQKTNENEKVYPFVNVIKFGGQVVAGTSPDTLLFTSANYKLSIVKPYVNVKTGKFTDPQKSNLSSDEWLALYAYVENIAKQLPQLAQYYTPEGKKSLVDYGNIGQELNSWLNEIKQNILKKGYDIEKATPLPVNAFQMPYSLIFNFSDELYGLNGIITQTDDSSGHAVKFNPENLLLEKGAEIARIPLGSDYSRNPSKLSDLSIYVLKANKVGQDGFAFFALPLSEEGVRVFGQNIGVLLGQDETGTSIKSQLQASYDEQSNTLDVKLLLITNEDKTKAINVQYKVRPEMISKKDLLLWPNFMSKQWKRYFLYSEIPHNVHSDNCPFRAVPFVGDENDPFFSTINDEDGNIIYLANEGRTNADKRVNTKLHIVADHRVADSKYQYEIYESEHPFKGVKLTTTTKESGFILIRYARENGKRMPWDRLGEQRELRDAHIGMDFGSTNTSIAYYDTVLADDPKGIVFKDMRVSLLRDIHGFQNTPTIENSLFFFQGQELQSNSVKSILTVQDFKRMPQDENVDALSKNEVSGGFPCFCKNLPVTSISDDKINVSFFNGTGISATLIQNMKWSDQDSDRAHKSAFLKSLLLQVYAQLFADDVVPVKLKWSYPSAMPDSLVRDYDSIWNDLKYITPVVDRDGNIKRLDVSEWQAGNVDVGENIWGAESDSSANDAWGTSAPSNDNWGGSTSGDAWGSDSSSGGWGDNDSSSSSWGSAESQDGWGNSPSSNVVVDLKPDGGPIKFDFVDVNQESCLTEACAVANFLHKSVDARNLTLCFDVGGSTTDISALCKMRDRNGQLRTAMIKQNSIRFAAQRVSLATRNISTFKKVLDAICQKYNIRILGLNMGQDTYTPETAPYFYEQIVDNLNSEQLIDFYKCISAISPDLFSVNLYVTGLIMYYAGQISNKLIQEVRRAEDGLGPEWKPLVQIVFAGKGSRIFEWFSCTNYDRAKKYCQDMFIHGFGNMEQAKNLLYGPPSIGLVSKSTPDNKFEVSKGLAMASHQSREGGLIVPNADKAIEILGEEGFSLITKDGSKVDLKYDNGITSEYMKHIGNYFLGPIDGAGEMTCKRFMDFSSIFYQYAKNLYKLDAKLSQSDFVNGFKNMNINSYIKSLPEYRKAIQNKGSDGSGKFDFVAPIIILEGMKFFDEVLLPKLKQ